MINRRDGNIIDDEIINIQQSIEDILTTPIGTRIMRRDYGSILMDLIDQPIHDALILKIYSAIYTAVTNWEKRISIEQINISQLSQGTLIVDLQAIYLTTNQNLNLNIPLQMGASS